MKSLHTKLAEAIDSLTKAQRDKYYESKPKGAPIEVLINCAEAAKAGKVKESTPLTKHNGRVTEFRESAGGQITETISKADQTLYAGLGISEADQRRVNGLPPAGANLTPSQLREFRFLRSIRLSESDALRGAQKVA